MAWEPAESRRFERDMRAIGKKVDDPAAFAAAVDLIDHLKLAVALAAQRLYDEGYSYAELAEPLGISRQVVSKRWPQSAGV